MEHQLCVQRLWIVGRSWIRAVERCRGWSAGGRRFNGAGKAACGGGRAAAAPRRGVSRDLSVISGSRMQGASASKPGGQCRDVRADARQSYVHFFRRQVTVAPSHTRRRAAHCCRRPLPLGETPARSVHRANTSDRGMPTVRRSHGVQRARSATGPHGDDPPSREPRDAQLPAEVGPRLGVAPVGYGRCLVRQRRRDESRGVSAPERWLIGVRKPSHPRYLPRSPSPCDIRTSLMRAQYSSRQWPSCRPIAPRLRRRRRVR